MLGPAPRQDHEAKERYEFNVQCYERIKEKYRRQKLVYAIGAFFWGMLVGGAIATVVFLVLRYT